MKVLHSGEVSIYIQVESHYSFAFVCQWLDHELNNTDIGSAII